MEYQNTDLSNKQTNIWSAEDKHFSLICVCICVCGGTNHS